MNTRKLSVVVLISGSGSNLQAFIDRSSELNISIKAVISNIAEAYGLERAKTANIPAFAVPHGDFASREDFDASLANHIHEYQPDLIILAGFMRILSADFVTAFKDKIINIHPSLLPKYKGLNTHQRAIEAGDEFHGASVHVVTPELDDGPVIIQGQLPIKEDATAESLQQQIHVIEHQIYPQAVKWIANGDVIIQNGQVIETHPLERLVTI